MYGLRHFVHNQVKNVVEAVTPTPTQSQFEDKRVCTAEGMHYLRMSVSWDRAPRLANLEASRQVVR
jgi:hypothetical protein